MILTGASGAGKTTIARNVQERYGAECDVAYFDSVGVPALEVMRSEFGGPERWQRAMTLRWMQRIAPGVAAGRTVLLEGQMRIAFVQEAIGDAEIEVSRIILVDCDDATRMARLHGERLQPELADATMMNWAQFLRDEARRKGVEILDTSKRTVESCVEVIAQRLFGA